MISISRSPFLLVPLVAFVMSACKPKTATGAADGPSVPGAAKVPNLKDAREGFTTHLLKKVPGDGQAPGPGRPGVMDLIHYTSPAGSLAAYVSAAPKDDKKHPIIIWIVGGFNNGIDADLWDDGPLDIDNEQTAMAYRKAGVAMMYPSLRGGNDNPGVKESFYGEVDDVLAATAYAAKLPWVDPERIYLGGHSTGGTLALLTAESAPEGTYRAVIAFGPANAADSYPAERLLFDPKDAQECRVRNIGLFLPAIHSPAIVIEGDHDSNYGAFLQLQKLSKNPLISFVLAKGYTHFTDLAPANAVLASKIAFDNAEKSNLSLTLDEIKASSAKLQHAAGSH